MLCLKHQQEYKVGEYCVYCGDPEVVYGKEIYGGTVKYGMCNCPCHKSNPYYGDCICNCNKNGAVPIITG